MLAAVSCLLIALVCDRVERIAGPLERPAATHALEGRPILFAATCTLSRRTSTISCAPATPTRAAGVSAHVMRSPTGTYAAFVPYNLVEDTVRQIWSFDAYVHDALQQSIGTLDGTTVTGSKIVVTAIYATQGTGTVSIVNADGIGNITAPNQPYFNYNQIVAAGANSSGKLWQVSVPNSVTVVSMDVVMTTDFPAEQTITLLPPDTIPAWIRADTNIAPPTDSSPGHYAKRVVIVVFRPTATLADRQLAIALVNGVVVGGIRTADGSLGSYYVKVPDGSEDGVFRAMEALNALPQVQFATLEVYLDPLASPE